MFMGLLAHLDLLLPPWNVCVYAEKVIYGIWVVGINSVSGNRPREDGTGVAVI